jgi:hypothetical protein
VLFAATAAGSNAERMQRMTRGFEPALHSLVPQSVPYVNELWAAAPDLVREASGPNLARLRQVRARWDPHDLFCVFAGVSSDAWAPAADGWLCRAD